MRYKIYKDSTIINTIVADEAFVTTYCAQNNYTYEEDISSTFVEAKQTTIPTQLDIIEAQITYTAMMTDTLLEG